VLLPAAALLVSACAGRTGPRTAAGEATEATGTERPWELPADAYPSQRLYRLEFDSAEGDGALRLVLRLADAGRYRLTIADRLGRPLYTVDAEPAGGLLLDHREQLFCSLAPDVRLEELPIDPLPLRALPGVLLGRLPEAPRRSSAPAADGREISFHDAAGRRWTATLSAPGALAGPESWTLWLDGEPAVWWRRLDDRAMLSDRRRGLRMTWREVGREPLASALGPAAAPDDYRLGVCGGEAAGLAAARPAPPSP
jgi:hypothetical protein